MENSLQALLNRLKNTLTNFNFSEVGTLYNPMEYFVDYVSKKELVHTKILTELLTIDGRHGFGDKFVKSFFNKFVEEDYSTVTSIYVTSERKVARVLTKGGNRSIDIFIEYKDKLGNKSAIIIENKLNDAYYQPLQLEDYYEAIKNEGFNNIKVVCIHEFWRPQDSYITISENHKPIILYPLDVAKWLKDSLTFDDVPTAYTLQSYIHYLVNLHAYNNMKENTKALFNLDRKSLLEVRVLAEAYNYIMDHRDSVIKEELLVRWPDIKVDKLGKRNVQIYNSKDYNRNGFWICIWAYSNSNSIYLVSKNNENHNDKVLISANYARNVNSTEYNWRWYESQREELRNYPYPDKAYFESMIQEINRLLEIMHKI